MTRRLPKLTRQRLFMAFAESLLVGGGMAFFTFWVNLNWSALGWQFVGGVAALLTLIVLLIIE